MINQILIPTDFSPASWQATKLGVEIAQLRNAKLNLLHIVPTVSRYSDEKKQMHLPDRMEEIKAKMDSFCNNLDDSHKLQIINHVVPGNVEQTLSKFIKSDSYDLVIMGVNSTGASNEIGSHTAELLESCGIPVLVVPNRKELNGAIAV